MSGTQGFRLTKSRRQVRDRIQALRDGAQDALASAVIVGARAMDDELERAVTKTGWHRMLTRAGGRPGRHDTGNMVSKIRTNAKHPSVTPDRITMAFGWFAGEFETYFKLQELGTGTIPAAHSLVEGSAAARVELMRGLRQVVR